MEKKRTIFHSTQSVVNWNQWGWMVWLKFDRITDDQQWQQTWNRAPFFAQTKPLSGLNVVQCGQDNGSLLILLEFILKPKLFAVLGINFEKRHWLDARPGYWETLGDFFCLSFGTFSCWAAVFMFDLFAAGEPHWRRISEWRLSKTLRLSMVVFCAS